MIDIAKLRELMRAAGFTPWWSENETAHRTKIHGDGEVIARTYCSNAHAPEIAALIVAAVNGMPELIERVEKLGSIVERFARSDLYEENGAATACRICKAWTYEGKPTSEVEHEDDCVYVEARALMGMTP